MTQEDIQKHTDHQHETLVHETAEKHHSHSHAQISRHDCGYHLLQVENLSIGFRMYDAADSSFFRAKQHKIEVIKNLSLSVHFGEILAIIGASGAGKTLLADAIMGMFEPNAMVNGTIWFKGEQQNESSLSQLRGNEIALVPQSTNYLDPLMKVGVQVRGFKSGKKGDKAARAKKQRNIFAHYQLDEKTDDLYPFEISGGMARRVLLASALIDDPDLIIADEPTPGLDLDLAVKAMADFRELADQGKGVLLITHDIELALRVADRVAVFKDGTVIEETAVANFTSPDLLEHPFTKELWHALPEHDFAVASADLLTQKRKGVSC